MPPPIYNKQHLDEAYSRIGPTESLSLASMEGVPEWDLERPVRKRGPKGMAWSLNRGLVWIGQMIPGLVLAGFLALCAQGIAAALGSTLFRGEMNPVSPVMIIILLGILFRNVIGVPDSYVDGLRFCIKTVLRIGIVLLGLRLSLTEVGQLGLYSLPVVLLCIGGALAMGLILTSYFKLSRRLGMLIAVGTSICGVSAVVATAPAIKARENEVSYSVACVTIFGLMGLLFYPYLAHWVFGVDRGLAGIFLGTAIHDTSQVVGAGLTYAHVYGEEATLEAATVTKLVRNLFMIGVIPLAVYLASRNSAKDGQGQKGKQLNIRGMIPVFVILFAGMALVRSLGDLGTKPFGVINEDHWKGVLNLASTGSGICFLFAMASLGLSTSLKKLRVLGLKPMLVGLAASTAVGLLSIGTLYLFYR